MAATVAGMTATPTVVIVGIAHVGCGSTLPDADHADDGVWTAVTQTIAAAAWREDVVTWPARLTCRRGPGGRRLVRAGRHRSAMEHDQGQFDPCSTRSQAFRWAATDSETDRWRPR